MAEPTIRLLGSTRVGPEGAQVELSALVERVLWQLVVVMPNAVPAHELAHALWDDSPPTSWESAMRTHVARLKKLLLADPNAPQVVHGRAGYALAGDRNTVDIFRFQSLIGRVESVASPAERRALREEAAQLWMGAPFRDAVEPVLRDLSMQVSDLHEDNERQRNLLAIDFGDGELVVDRLQPGFEADPTAVVVVEPLVTALLRLGRVHEAKATLVRHRSSLDLRGLEPSSAAISLERHVLTEELAGGVNSGLLGEVPAMLRQDKVLVGRDEEVLEFSEILQTDSIAFVVLQGAAGIGKSHLASAFAKEARRNDIPVLATWADEHSPPFQPIADLLQPWTESIGAPSGESLELLLSALVDLSPNRRLLVIFEDLHFADLATTKVLRRIVRRKPVDGVTFVFTVRDTFRNPLVDQLLRDLDGLDTARTRQVGPLTLDDTFELVRVSDRLSPSAAWTRASRLYRMSAGFPLVLDFLLADRSESDRQAATGEPESDAVLDSREWAEFPAQPIDAAGVTLSAASRLDEADLDIVVTGSILGLVIDVPVLVDAVSSSIARVHDALDRAHSAGLTEQRSGNSVRFRHPLIRRALWQSRTAVWRCERSRDLADVLARRSRDVFAVSQQLAFALPNETSNAVLRRVFHGVEQLHEQQRWEEAFSLLETVAGTLDLSPWWVEVDDVFRYHVLFAISADGCADGELAREHFRKAKALADTEQRADWLFEVAIRSSASSQPLDGDMERSNWLRLAFDQKSGLDDFRRMQALSEFVYLRGLAAVDAEVNECVSEMERLAALLSDDRMRAYYAHGALVTQLCSPNALARLEFTEKARAWGGSVPPEVAVTPILVGVFSLLQLGRRAEVDTEIAEIERLVNLRQRPGDRWMMLLYRAMLAEWDGDADAAQRHALAARNLAIRHEIHGGREAWGLFQISRLYRTDDRATARRFASDRDDVTLVEQAASARFLATDDQRPTANRIVERVLNGLTASPPNLLWPAACLAATEAAALCESAALEPLFALLLPFSGLFVINGLVASSSFGPVDRVLHIAAKTLGDTAAAATFERRLSTQLAESGLSGWNLKR